MKKWDLTNLRQQLENLKRSGKIYAYTAGESVLNRQEYYLIQSHLGKSSSLDQAREVSSDRARAKVLVEKPGQKLGSAEAPLLFNNPLEPQLQKLIDKALLGEEEFWELPKYNAQSASSPKVAYEGFKENFSASGVRIAKDLQDQVNAGRGIFNSTELFLNFETNTSLASNGFESRNEKSSIYAEVCFSAEDKVRQVSDEFLLTSWACHPDQLNFSKMCQESAEYAQASLKTEKPRSGNYTVILGAEVLNTLWHDVFAQLNLRNQYFKMPSIEKGTDFIKDYRGDSFQCYCDPMTDYALSSAAFDSVGFAQKRVELVSNNRVQENLVDPRIGQYLKKQPTTSLGAVVIETKGQPVDKLRKGTPCVLEILQFSGLFSDPMSLTYSSEIRLARLYDNESGKIFYVKGGNLSGNFMENFKNVQWSEEQKVVNYMDGREGGMSYKGPAYALVDGVSISS